MAWLACPTEAFAQLNSLVIFDITYNNKVTPSEKAVGFVISGTTGTESGVIVTVTVKSMTDGANNSTTLTSVTSNSSGRWSVDVPPGASYISPDADDYSVDVVATDGTTTLSHPKSFDVDLTLPLSVDDDIVGDDTINAQEKTDGFTISGDIIDSPSDVDNNKISGVAVTVTIGTGSLSATSGDDGKWLVTVPRNAKYISGTSVLLSVTATLAGGYVDATVTRTLPVDLTASTVSYNTVPSSLTVGVAITAMAPTTSDTDIASYGVHDDDSLPSGLAIDGITGVISGEPPTANTFAGPRGIHQSPAWPLRVV